MKKWIPLFLLASCTTFGKVVTMMMSFYEIDLRTTASQVVAALGQPYAIHKKDDGAVEYEYIERIKIGGRDAEERHYFILIKDGVVVLQTGQTSSPLPYGFDSYDMQTTERSE